MLTPTQKESARFLIRRYLERCEDNRRNIHYKQFRPMNHLGRSPSRGFTADCSGLATSAFDWADIHTAFKVLDPNGSAFRFRGYGYTGTLVAANRTRRVPLDRKFFVGDLAIYGSSFSNTKHVVICRKEGNAFTAIWTSHGSEAGPYPVTLHYRRDLLIVVRSASLA